MRGKDAGKVDGNSSTLETSFFHIYDYDLSKL